MELDNDVLRALKEQCECMAEKSRAQDGSYCVTSHSVREIADIIRDFGYDLTEKGRRHLIYCTQWNEDACRFDGATGPANFLATLEYICDPESEIPETFPNKQEPLFKKARHAEHEPRTKEGRVHQPKHTEKQTEIDIMSIDVQRQNHKYVVDQFVSEGKLDLYEASYDMMAEELKFAYGPLGHIVKLAGRGRTNLLAVIIMRYWTHNLHPLFDIQPSLCGLESICNNILFAAIYANNKSMIKDIALLDGPFKFVSEYGLKPKSNFAWGIVIEPNADALHEYVRIVKEYMPDELPNVTTKLWAKLGTREPHHKPLILDLLKQIEELPIELLDAKVLKQIIEL